MTFTLDHRLLWVCSCPKSSYIAFAVRWESLAKYAMKYLRVWTSQRVKYRCAVALAKHLQLIHFEAKHTAALAESLGTPATFYTCYWCFFVIFYLVRFLQISSVAHHIPFHFTMYACWTSCFSFSHHHHRCLSNWLSNVCIPSISSLHNQTTERNHNNSSFLYYNSQQSWIWTTLMMSTAKPKTAFNQQSGCQESTSVQGRRNYAFPALFKFVSSMYRSFRPTSPDCPVPSLACFVPVWTHTSLNPFSTNSSIHEQQQHLHHAHDCLEFILL